MADLNADGNALVVIDGNDSGQAVDVAVEIDAEASMGDAAGSRYRARLHTGAAGPARENRPWWAKCQSTTCPSAAQYWHMGVTKTRFLKRTPRSANGRKSAGKRASEVMSALGRSPDIDCFVIKAGFGHHAARIGLDFMHQGQHLVQPVRAFPAELLEPGQRRAHVAYRIPGSRREGFRIALVPVGRMALGDDPADRLGKLLDMLGLLDPPAASRSHMREVE